MIYTDTLLEPNFPMSNSLHLFKTKFRSFLSVFSERHRSWSTLSSSVPKLALGRKLEPRAMTGALRILYIIFFKFFNFLLYKWSSNHSLLHAQATAHCSFSKRAHRVADPANCTEPACVARVRWFDRNDMQLNEIGKDTAVDS